MNYRDYLRSNDFSVALYTDISTNENNKMVEMYQYVTPKSVLSGANSILHDGPMVMGKRLRYNPRFIFDCFMYMYTNHKADFKYLEPITSGWFILGQERPLPSVEEYTDFYNQMPTTKILPHDSRYVEQYFGESTTYIMPLAPTASGYNISGATDGSLDYHNNPGAYGLKSVYDLIGAYPDAITRMTYFFDSFSDSPNTDMFLCTFYDKEVKFFDRGGVAVLEGPSCGFPIERVAWVRNIRTGESFEVPNGTLINQFEDIQPDALVQQQLIPFIHRHNPLYRDASYWTNDLYKRLDQGLVQEIGDILYVNVGVYNAIFQTLSRMSYEEYVDNFYYMFNPPISREEWDGAGGGVVTPPDPDPGTGTGSDVNVVKARVTDGVLQPIVKTNRVRGSGKRNDPIDINWPVVTQLIEQKVMTQIEKEVGLNREIDPQNGPNENQQLLVKVYDIIGNYIANNTQWTSSVVPGPEDLFLRGNYFNKISPTTFEGSDVYLINGVEKEATYTLSVGGSGGTPTNTPPIGSGVSDSSIDAKLVAEAKQYPDGRPYNRHSYTELYVDVEQMYKLFGAATLEPGEIFYVGGTLMGYSTIALYGVFMQDIGMLEYFDIMFFSMTTDNPVAIITKDNIPNLYTQQIIKPLALMNLTRENKNFHEAKYLDQALYSEEEEWTADPTYLSFALIKRKDFEDSEMFDYYVLGYRDMNDAPPGYANMFSVAYSPIAAIEPRVKETGTPIELYGLTLRNDTQYYAVQNATNDNDNGGGGIAT